MIEELGALEKVESEREKYQEIRLAIVEKMLAPLSRMILLTDQFG